MTGRRGKVRALAGICHVHESKLFLTQHKSHFSGGSLFSKTSACSLAPARRFLVTLCPPLHEIFAFLKNIRLRLACVRTSRETDFRYNKDFCLSKYSFRGHDMSQGLDREPPSLSPHFLLIDRMDCSSGQYSFLICGEHL